MKQARIKLRDGNSIPQIGLGLWQIKDEAEFKQAFNAAIKAGYKHFDTAQAYHNEQFLGDSIQQSGIKREELFITTKIAVQNFGSKKSLNSFNKSLQKLKLDYVDLVLLHFPVPALRKTTWKVVEEIKKQGLAKSIGVSNYTIKHLQQMEGYATEMPVVDQVEMHLFLQQKKLREYAHQHNVAIEAYSPLAHAKQMDDDLIKKLAKKYQVSYAQIMLRWCLQSDVIIIPKSVSPKRIAENIDIFNFKISDEDMEQLAKLDNNLHTCWNPELVP